MAASAAQVALTTVDVRPAILPRMGRLVLAWVYGVLAGLWVVQVGDARGIDLDLSLAWEPSWNFRGEALLLTAVGPACVLVVRRCNPSARSPIPEARLRAHDVASALAAGLIAATVLRWSTLLQVVSWWSLPGVGVVGSTRACASAAFAGATAWLVCRGLWVRLDEQHDIVAALGGTAGVLLLQRGVEPFIYGSIF